MYRAKFSTFLSDYGMIFVLFFLCVIFTFTTFQEQAATGKIAGQNLAAKVVSSATKDVILIVH